MDMPYFYVEPSHRTPLFHSVERGHLGAVRLLLASKNIQVNAKDKLGRTALHWATMEGHNDVVKALLDQEETMVNELELHGRTPAVYAVMLSRRKVVDTIVEEGLSSWDFAVRNDLELIHYAAGYGDERLLSLLLGLPNVEADKDDKSVRSPLTHAMSARQQAIIRALLERADVDPLRPQGPGSAIEMALVGDIYINSSSFIRLFVESGRVSPGTSIRDQNVPLLNYAVNVGAIKVVDYLLQQVDDPTFIKDTKGDSPLSYAVVSESLEVLDRVLEHPSIDVNAQKNSGITPLVIALLKGNMKAIQRLLNHPGLAINAANPKGITGIHVAAKFADLNLVQLLCEFGADCNNLDMNGRSVLDWTEHNPKQDIIEYLINLGAEYLHHDNEADSFVTDQPYRLVKRIANKARPILR